MRTMTDPVELAVLGEKQRELREEALPIPFTPLYWRVLIEIDEVEETYGESRIVIPESTRKDEEYLTYVGRVVAIGDLAFQAETRAKLCLKDDGNNPEVGDYVVFYKNAGTRFRTIEGRLFVLLSDTEIWGVTDDPKRLDCLSL